MCLYYAYMKRIKNMDEFVAYAGLKPLEVACILNVGVMIRPDGSQYFISRSDAQVESFESVRQRFDFIARVMDKRRKKS